MSKVSSVEFAQSGAKYLGTPYSVMDCQAFVERCLADCGVKKDLAGSNAWFRFVAANGWTGSPEECRQKFGYIPAGALLFILNQDGKEPEKYQGDGIGNASHIGIFTNTGKGAIHSSASKGCVCESTFKGKSISGGWNQIGLWNGISYGDTIDPILDGGSDSMEVNYQARVTGGSLKLRKTPSMSADWICRIPDGTMLTITEELDGWGKTSYDRRTGWVMLQYLEAVNADQDMVSVSRKELEGIYDTLGDWLGLRG